MRQVLPGDRYLICSDGLSGVVSAETIARDACASTPTRSSASSGWSQLALRGGGPDNITVVVADATDEDIVEEAPIVGGAAARDRGMATSADDSTPAARASALAARPAAAAARAVRRRRRRAATSRTGPAGTRCAPSCCWSCCSACSAAACGPAGSYTQSQYYVGATDDGQIAVFRACPGQIAGFDLSSVHETSATELDDLTTVAQERVKQGIQAENEPDAERRLAELTSDDPANPNRKPFCPPPRRPPSAAGGRRHADQRRRPPATAGPTTARRRRRPPPTEHAGRPADRAGRRR